MRTLAIIGFTFILTTLAVWFCCGFISAIWNPMAWAPVGRFLFVALALFVAGPMSVCAGMCYEEHLSELKRKG